MRSSSVESYLKRMEATVREEIVGKPALTMTYLAAAVIVSAIESATFEIVRAIERGPQRDAR